MTERKTQESTAKARVSAAKAPSREGAPRLETPESPKEPPKETPRDEQAPLETPESPAVPPVPSEEELVELKKDDLEEEAAAHDLPVSGTKAELADRIVEQVQVEVTEKREAELEREAFHVSISPVNSHAPVWYPHTPNTEGGYS